jgi:uncharacterized protein YecA (UPF0149 family)
VDGWSATLPLPWDYFRFCRQQQVLSFEFTPFFLPSARKSWAELFDDEEQDGGCLIPMMMLHHEYEDPEMRPEPISPDKREEVIVHMAAGLLGAYQYFRSPREVSASARPREPRRTDPKVGRNDQCPCGSGKKYKRCCRGATVN